MLGPLAAQEARGASWGDAHRSPVLWDGSRAALSPRSLGETVCVSLCGTRCDSSAGGCAGPQSTSPSLVAQAVGRGHGDGVRACAHGRHMAGGLSSTSLQERLSGCRSKRQNLLEGEATKSLRRPRARRVVRVARVLVLKRILFARRRGSASGLRLRGVFSPACVLRPVRCRAPNGAVPAGRRVSSPRPPGSARFSAGCLPLRVRRPVFLV